MLTSKDVTLLNTKIAGSSATFFFGCEKEINNTSNYVFPLNDQAKIVTLFKRKKLLLPGQKEDLRLKNNDFHKGYYSDNLP